MRRTGLAVATLIALGAAGCADSTTPAASPATSTTAASPSPSVPPTPPAQDEYDTAQRLVGALNKAGTTCINWERVETPIGALERGSCYAGTEEIVASIYGSQEEAAAEPANKGEILAGVSDVVMVVGGNWTLSCETEETCERIEASFGGRLIVVPA
jgi:hypothetical protein